jgi:hypothetical protein
VVDRALLVERELALLLEREPRAVLALALAGLALARAGLARAARADELAGGRLDCVRPDVDRALGVDFELPLFG